ncbi:hypothetical protein [Streptomyces abikoensis]|uniref:Uncharacterized protein n=1 Tax=Streptomyces abikoensis TaxID=97398 RepID=A0ABW7TCH2_9ACTN
MPFPPGLQTVTITDSRAHPDTTAVHGIADTAQLETQAGALKAKRADGTVTTIIPA